MSHQSNSSLTGDERQTAEALRIAGAAGPLGDPDVLAAPTERDKFEAWYLRDHFNVKTAAASLAWSAWQASKVGTVSIEEYRRVVARCCELGEKIANLSKEQTA